jgi:hypothetical protein
MPAFFVCYFSLVFSYQVVAITTTWDAGISEGLAANNALDQ